MILKEAVSDPMVMLRKAGFVQTKTGRPSDVMDDEFRGDISHEIRKGVDGHSLTVPESNADFHAMDWAEIHELAGHAKTTGAVGNNVGMEMDWVARSE